MSNARTVPSSALVETVAPTAISAGFWLMTSVRALRVQISARGRGDDGASDTGRLRGDSSGWTSVARRGRKDGSTGREPITRRTPSQGLAVRSSDRLYSPFLVSVFLFPTMSYCSVTLSERLDFVRMKMGSV